MYVHPTQTKTRKDTYKYIFYILCILGLCIRGKSRSHDNTVNVFGARRFKPRTYIRYRLYGKHDSTTIN